MQRLALLGFGALLILLFLIVAIAQGIGSPSIPSGAVAVVEDAPDDLGTVTEKDFLLALDQSAAQSKVPVPKEGTEKYDQLKETALREIFDSIWIRGQAAEMGFSVTPKEVAKELEKLKKQAFKTEKQYDEFLEESHFTQADVDKRVTIQILSKNIQDEVTENTPQPTKSEIEDYYEAAKSSQYTTPESREIRVIKNKDKAEVEAAKAKLEKDDSPKSWGKVAKEFSTDTTKGSGGLQTGVTEGQLPEPLDAAIFAAPQGELEGPIKEAKTYAVFEVMKVTPEKVQSLDEVKSGIATQLAEQAKQANFNSFVSDYIGRWTERTYCGSGFAVITHCRNYKTDGRPPESNPACYEEDPKGGLPEVCEAPIPQVKPALPGTVNPLTPEGQKLTQTPRPKEAEAAAPEGAALPPGAEAPPTGE